MYRNSKIGSDDRKFCGRRASCVKGIDLHDREPLLARKNPSSLTELEGQGRPLGVIGLEGGELHDNGTHWRLLLIPRKDRLPNGNVRLIRRLCLRT